MCRMVSLTCVNTSLHPSVSSHGLEPQTGFLLEFEPIVSRSDFISCNDKLELKGSLMSFSCQTQASTQQDEW